MWKIIRTNDFASDEAGAVTVDWVVLTAAIIGLGVAVMSSVGSGATDLADDVQGSLTDSTIMSYLPTPTFGDVVSIAMSGSLPRTCVPMKMDQDGNISGGGCNIQEQSSITSTTYEMSDGSEWRKSEVTTVTYLEDTQNSATETGMTTIWYNEDNEVEDAPEAT